MAQYPNGIYTPRETENLPGLVYDPANKRNFFSEDFQNNGQEITAIEKTLGVQVQNGVLSLAERLDNYDLIFNKLMLHKKIILTNDQIKALPSSPIRILDAPTTGKGYLTFFATCFLHSSAGYTNLDLAGGIAFLQQGVGFYTQLCYIEDNATGPITDYTDFFTSSVPTLVPLPLLCNNNAALGYNSPFAFPGAQLLNVPVDFVIFNAAGDLTGGADGNLLEIDLWYAEIDAV